MAARSPDVGNRVATVVVESRQRRELVELDVSGRIDRLHRRYERLRMAPDVREKGIRVVERQVADLELERAVARDDVERRPAANRADVRRRERNVVRQILAV